MEEMSALEKNETWEILEVRLHSMRKTILKNGTKQLFYISYFNIPST